MAVHDYHFVSHWRVLGDCHQVYLIIDQPLELTRWWPMVYLEVRELESGDERGIGKVVELLTKGWLPYKLRWWFRSIEKVVDERIVLEAWGDFVGRGIWTFKQSGDWTDIEYDWRIRAEKPLLRALSFLLKPIFAANHHWAMSQGEKCLQRELDRLSSGPNRK